MQRSTLERWLLRSIAGKPAERVELRHKGSDDEESTVATYDLGDGQRDTLADIAGNALADAQNECDMMEMRASFKLRVMSQDDKELASTRMRFEPSIGGENASEEPSREGLLSMALDNLKFAYRELGAAPARQRAVYEDIVDFQRRLITELRAENKALQTLLFEQHGEDLQAAAEAAKEREHRSTMLQKAIDEGMEIAKLMLLAATNKEAGAAAAAEGGYTNGATQ